MLPVVAEQGRSNPAPYSALFAGVDSSRRRFEFRWGVRKNLSCWLFAAWLAPALRRAPRILESPDGHVLQAAVIYFCGCLRSMSNYVRP